MQSNLPEPIIILAIALAAIVLILGFIICMRVCVFTETQEERDRLQTHDAKPLSPLEIQKEQERRKRIKQKYYT